jgi:hypothetical protein
MLHRRADALIGMLRLFHGGLEFIAHNSGTDRLTLVQRLQDILDTFVPVAQKFGDMFGHEPTLLLPKVRKNILHFVYWVVLHFLWKSFRN